MANISNVTTEEFIEEEKDDFQRNSVGDFSSDRTTSFLNWWKEKVVSTFLWYWIQIEATYQVLIDGAYFIEQDDGDITNKILYNTKKFNKKANTVILVIVTFSTKKLWKTKSKPGLETYFNGCRLISPN